MTTDSEDPRSLDATRRSWRAVADVVGHCVLVFAFVPPVAALPRWLYFEAHNPFNLRDAIVLAYLPVRGLLLLLDAFSAGVVQHVLAGVFAGVLLSALFLRLGRTSTPLQRIVVGAIGGAVAACLAALTLVTVRRVFQVEPASNEHTVFDLVSGTLCGMIAAFSTPRFLSEVKASDLAPLRASNPGG